MAAEVAEALKAALAAEVEVAMASQAQGAAVPPLPAMAKVPIVLVVAAATPPMPMPMATPMTPAATAEAQTARGQAVHELWLVLAHSLTDEDDRARLRVPGLAGLGLSWQPPIAIIPVPGLAQAAWSHAMITCCHSSKLTPGI